MTTRASGSGVSAGATWRAACACPVTAEFTRLEVAGDAAFCRLEVSRDGKRTFTDFLALYRFADGWKIVGKSYYRWGES